MKKFNWIIAIVMFATGLLLYETLPSTIPTHWNVKGEVDGYMLKQVGVWLLPSLVVAMNILFKVVPKLDPKKEKYQLFAREWKIIQAGLVVFFAYIYGISLYIALHPETAMLPFMFLGLGTLFVLIGNYLSKIRQNFFVGIKLPWTLANEENWNKTHKLASWCFVVAGIITLIEAKLLWYSSIVVFGSIMSAAIVPMVYSFLLFKKQK